MPSDLTFRLGGARSSLAFKAPCRVATAANITLSGFQTIDGVTLAAGDTNLRVLVKSQTNAVENGIYEAKSGAWTRAKDFDGSDDIVKGTRAYVAAGGTTYGDTGWVVSTADPILIDTSSITLIAPTDEFSTAAAASATAAASSASAASTSATTATTQATNAASSATSASTSASTATTQATNAASSATSASTSASTATTQASNAASSATSASSSASSASTSATNASTSATNAAAAAGFTWTVSNSITMDDPGVGGIRFNNATIPSVTAIAIDDQSADTGNPDVSSRILTWDDSTNTSNKGTLLLRKGNSAWLEFTVTSLTDNSGWTELAVTYVGHSGSLSANDTLVSSFYRTGNKGSDGAGTGDVVGPASATDNAVARFDSTTGKLIQSSAVTIADTTGVIAGAKFANAAGLPVLDSDSSHVLGITTSSNLTADRLLTLVTGDAARTVTISGNATISQDYSSTGSPTFAAPAVTTIELGHATDTTLARVSAGVISVEGETVHTNSISRGITASVVNLGHASDTTVERAAAGELSVEGVVLKKVGKETIFIPAGAMIARTTNGGATGTTELATNDVMLRTLDFDTTTEEGVGFWVAMPKSWNESTVTFKAFWTAASGSGGVAWGLAAYSFSDDDAMDTAVSGQQIVTDTLITANDMHVTAESSAITIGGTPADGDAVYFELTREVANGSDTLAVDARLIGVHVYITTNASTDA